METQQPCPVLCEEAGILFPRIHIFTNSGGLPKKFRIPDFFLVEKEEVLFGCWEGIDDIFTLKLSFLILVSGFVGLILMTRGRAEIPRDEGTDKSDRAGHMGCLLACTLLSGFTTTQV